MDFKNATVLSEGLIRISISKLLFLPFRSGITNVQSTQKSVYSKADLDPPGW